MNPKTLQSQIVHLEGKQIELFNVDESELLHTFWVNHGGEEKESGAVDLAVKAIDGRLAIQWAVGDGKPLTLTIDIDAFVKQQKSFPAARRGVLNQALGRKTHTIVDLTAGWGADALLFCSQGYVVTLIERHPLIQLMLQDAMQRLGNSRWAKSHSLLEPKVYGKDAKRWLQSLDQASIDQIDCLYVDPMFPAKRKQSAAPAKEMQFLQWLLGAQNDAEELLTAAIDSGVKRVVVKRPKYAQPLRANPSERFSGKLIHYDVYLNHG